LKFSTIEAAMGLNIKDETVHRLARERADLTGDSMPGAIRLSPENKLEQLRHACQQDREKRLRKLREILDSLPPLPPGVTRDHSDLYEDDGRPA
jgi:antitoxin VapB